MGLLVQDMTSWTSLDSAQAQTRIAKLGLGCSILAKVEIVKFEILITKMKQARNVPALQQVDLVHFQQVKAHGSMGLEVKYV